MPSARIANRRRKSTDLRLTAMSGCIQIWERIAKMFGNGQFIDERGRPRQMRGEAVGLSCSIPDTRDFPRRPSREAKTDLSRLLGTLGGARASRRSLRRSLAQELLE